MAISVKVSPLKVSDFPKKERRTSEASFETTFYKRLEARGFTNWHMSCRDAGWPDRYVRGGIWIEFKSLHALKTDHQLSKPQEIKLDELTKAGDRCFYCAKHGKTVLLLSWAEYGERLKSRIDLSTLPRFAYRDKRDIDAIIDGVFI